MTERLLIGAMSGTSADGVDAALVSVAGRGLTMRASLLAHVEHAYPRSLRERVLRARSEATVALAELADLGRAVSLAYVEAVQALLAQTSTKPADIIGVAAHGQTLFHAPPLTIQWFDPALIAAHTGTDVIADFRRADCAVGGQGAPLVPFADYVMFRSDAETRVLLNIGGISNVTLLSAGGSLEDVRGFDTGPGNCVSDWLMRDCGGVDRDGRLALAGTPRDDLVAELMRDAYFRAPPPKSTDGPAMIEIWRRVVPAALPLPDQLATAASWVGRCVRDAIGDLPTPRLIVAGGGTRNPAIMQTLPDAITADALGVPAQAREAMAFAILGAATLDRVPANVLSVTGASRPVVLGAIYPGSRPR